MYETRQDMLATMRNTAERFLQHALGIAKLPRDKFLQVIILSDQNNELFEVTLDPAYNGDIDIIQQEHGQRISISSDYKLIEGEINSQKKTDRDLRLIKGRLFSWAEQLELLLVNHPERVSIVCESDS